MRAKFFYHLHFFLVWYPTRLPEAQDTYICVLTVLLVCLFRLTRHYFLLKFLLIWGWQAGRERNNERGKRGKFEEFSWVKSNNICPWPTGGLTKPLWPLRDHSRTPAKSSWRIKKNHIRRNTAGYSHFLFLSNHEYYLLLLLNINIQHFYFWTHLVKLFRLHQAT